MKRNNLKAYLYILPVVFLALAFVYYPFIRSFVSSFFTVSYSGKLVKFTGLKNYTDLFHNRFFLDSLKASAIFMLLFVPINTVLVLLAAVLTERKEKKNAFFETIFILPLSISLSSWCMIASFMFDQNIGIINSVFHSHIMWFESPMASRMSLVITGIFLDFGLDYLLLLTALRNVEKCTVDAARLDGANIWQQFVSIKLPQIRNTLSFVIFMAIKDSFLICSPIIILTEGGPDRATSTVVHYYYLESFKNGNLTAGYTLSTVLFVISLILIILYNLYTNRRPEA